MAGSPRSRIDQFFASKKRKPPPLKDEKTNKDSTIALNVSPSAKGTLDSYLVKSPDASVLVTHRPHNDRGISPRQDLVKRNLTREINLTSNVIHRPPIPEDISGGGEKLQKTEYLRGTSTDSFHLNNQVPVKEAITNEACSENSELKRFATDFLSLYCSELPSTASAPLEENLKGHKRNVSPSLLVANSKTVSKKLCIITDQDHPSSGKGEIFYNQDCPEFVNREMRSKPEEASPIKSSELDGTMGKDRGEHYMTGSGVYAVLRKCNNAPISSLSDAQHRTPGSSGDVPCTRETPKSAFRSFMFSPGEEFWNEAIQAAEGLYDPDDKLSVQVVKGYDVRKGHNEPGNLCSLRRGKFGDKLLEGRSSSGPVPPQGVGNLTKSADINFEDGHLELSERTKLTEKCTPENDETVVLVKQNKTSPLPVKHFDFSLEDNNIDENILHLPFEGKMEDSMQIKKGQTDSGLVKCQGLQSSSILTHCEALRHVPKGKLDGSLQAIIPYHPSSLIGESLTVHESTSNLVTEDFKRSQRKETSTMQNDESITHDVPVLGCNPSNGKQETNNCSKNDAGTPLSSMLRTDSLNLSSWLPSDLCSLYIKKGISQLYPWQVDCLQVDGVLERRNLVYCASTSAGKSFVAEILMLRRVIATGKMALLVLPYVSICAEKAEHLEVLLEPLGKHVRSFYGNQGGGSLPKDTSVAVCTIEKANSLVNRLLEEGRLSEVGIIVIDELHMVGDQHRGYLLELMLTKLRYASGEGNSESSSGDSPGTSSGRDGLTQGLQIVGMSATMPNVASVADWLQAALYETDFRPVPLEEYIKVGNTIFNKKMDAVRTISKTSELGGKDPDHIVELCNEVVQEGHSVLIFCSSRKGCESTARHISKFIKKFCVGTREGVCEFSDASSAIEALRKCPAGLDPILEETLPAGVAYHHAGLTVEEREVIESCYRKGLVRVLTATSTLAAGVNLPARRVIFRQPRIGRDFIDGTRYKQMAGRAGRTGIDTRGESILICKPEEVKRITAVLNDGCSPLQSCLSEDKNGMTHAILEVVSGGIVQTASDIHRYVRCTLLNSTKPFQDVVKSAQDSLRWLCYKKFLEWNDETKLYSTTPLGRAAFGSSLTPEESLVVLDDLSRAREGIVLASDLHLVYLVTPINVDVQPDWELYYERFMELSALDQSVGNRVGVVEPFLMRMAHGAPLHIPDKLRGKMNGFHEKLRGRGAASDSSLLSDDQTVRISKRFYVALMLSRLVQEVPVAEVCEGFKVARGMIQALQENAGRFASMVSLFCERLGWHDLEGLVAKFQNRVSFGVRAEIVELTTIPYVKGSRARALYKAGLRTPLAIAESSVPEIAKAIFESSSWAVQEGTAVRRMQLGVAKKIINGARKFVFDQAEEARVAAFSAFKSLGVHVPQLSRPLGSANIKNFVIQDSNTTSNSEEPVVCVDSENLKKHSPIAAGLSSEDRNDGFKDGYLGIRRGNLTVKTDITSSIEFNSAVAVPCNYTEVNSGVSVKSASICGPSIKLNTDSNPGDSFSPVLEYAGNVTDVLDGESEHNRENGCGAKGGLSNHINGKNSVKGPVNASNIPGGFDSFLDCWDSIKEFYFDIHFNTRSELNSPVAFEVFGMAVCWENSPVYYINLAKDLISSCKLNKLNRSGGVCGISVDGDSKAVALNDLWDLALHRWKRIAKIMGGTSARKITWNLKVQIQVLKSPGISIQRFSGLRVEYKEQNEIEVIDNSYILLPSIFLHDGIDICLVAWILWPDEESKSSPNLEKVVKKRLSSEDAAAASRDGRWRNQMHKVAHNGCCRRVAQIRALSFVLWKLLSAENLVEVLARIEFPLVKVLADMELWGIGVDMEACLHARHILGKKLKELEKGAYKLAGMSFSLYASADIANVLYTHLKLPVPEGCNKGKQHPSTDKRSLDLLRSQHPIIAVIREHRTLAKLLNSTLGSICSRARLCAKSQRYIIKGHWLQTSTATGRLSMEEPNLQCVEHMVDFTTHHFVKDNSSSLDVDHHQINARDLFIPTQENWVLLTADYSQIELRLMAHFSKDYALIELLSKPDGDVFTMIAARWTGKMELTVSSVEREQAKRLVYGILYGMGANTLAEQLNCSSEEAAEKIQNFKTSFPGVSSWLKEAIASCRSKGYIETLMGRKRFLSKIKLGNGKEKSKAQRQAVNSICQGSAADIIKLAMIKIHSVAVEECSLFNSDAGFTEQFSMLKGRCRILLQVHDELVLETDPSLIKESALLLQVSMESAVSLHVPLPVKLKVGRTWGSLEPFHVE